MITLSMGHKITLASDTLIDFQIKFSISIGETVTHWFTLIVLSALRRLDNENMLCLMNLIHRDLSVEFKDCSDNSINKVNAASTLVPTVRQIYPNNTNTFSGASPSNAAANPTYGKSSFIDASQLPDDPDMLELEDITYSNDEDDNKDKQNRLMQIDELHKFNNGTLADVRTALDDRLKGIQMKYLPQSIWRKSDKDRIVAMIQAIDKRLKTRRIMRSLERFVGGRLYEGDFRMLQRTI
nr:hypothetical protein [Tanacetum cinerariifolium]